MDTKQRIEQNVEVEDKNLPEYEAPQVTTYTDEEILEELGPAQAGDYVGKDLGDRVF